MDEPACHGDALKVLHRAGIGVRRIVAVDIDSILFIDALGKPWTAWLDGSKVTATLPGFAAEPPVRIAEVVGRAGSEGEADGA